MDPHPQQGRRRLYTLDRETGEVLWANPTISQNVISGDENLEALFSALGHERLPCPSWAAGKDSEAGAYSSPHPDHVLPLRNACQRLLSTTERASSTYMPAAATSLLPAPTGSPASAPSPATPRHPLAPTSSARPPVRSSPGPAALRRQCQPPVAAVPRAHRRADPARPRTSPLPATAPQRTPAGHDEPVSCLSAHQGCPGARRCPRCPLVSADARVTCPMALAGQPTGLRSGNPARGDGRARRPARTSHR